MFLSLFLQSVHCIHCYYHDDICSSMLFLCVMKVIIIHFFSAVAILISLSTFLSVLIKASCLYCMHFMLLCLLEFYCIVCYRHCLQVAQVSRGLVLAAARVTIVHFFACSSSLLLTNALTQMQTDIDLPKTGTNRPRVRVQGDHQFCICM